MPMTFDLPGNRTVNTIGEKTMKKHIAPSCCMRETEATGNIQAEIPPN